MKKKERKERDSKTNIRYPPPYFIRFRPSLYAGLNQIRNPSLNKRRSNKTSGIIHVATCNKKERKKEIQFASKREKSFPTRTSPDHKNSQLHRRRRPVRGTVRSLPQPVKNCGQHHGRRHTRLSAEHAMDIPRIGRSTALAVVRVEMQDVLEPLAFLLNIPLSPEVAVQEDVSGFGIDEFEARRGIA